MYPLLSLAQIIVDPDVARSLPRRLAYYHLALPIARDGDTITVAMAHPDNQQVMEVIRAALAAQITPVRSHAHEIHRFLDALWAGNDESQPSGMLLWTDESSASPVVQAYAQPFAIALGEEILEPISSAPLMDFVAQVHTARPVLAVCAAHDLETCRTLIAELPVSLLLMRGSVVTPRSILHVMRGHTPDQRARDWVIPLAQHFHAEVTLLIAAASVTAQQGNPLMSDLSRLIQPEHPAQVVEYGQMLASMQLKGRIRIAEGKLETVLSETLASAPYDLVAIATENKGQFVRDALARLSHQSALLVIKP